MGIDFLKVVELLRYWLEAHGLEGVSITVTMPTWGDALHAAAYVKEEASPLTVKARSAVPPAVPPGCIVIDGLNVQFKGVRDLPAPSEGTR